MSAAVQAMASPHTPQRRTFKNRRHRAGFSNLRGAGAGWVVTSPVLLHRGRRGEVHLDEQGCGHLLGVVGKIHSALRENRSRGGNAERKPLLRVDERLVLEPGRRKRRRRWIAK